MEANVRALCRCGIRIPSARNRRPAFDKDKYLEPMFGDVGQARTNAAMLLLMIDTTSSRTCTKPTVACCFYFFRLMYNPKNIKKGIAINATTIILFVFLFVCEMSNIVLPFIFI